MGFLEPSLPGMPRKLSTGNQLLENLGRVTSDHYGTSVLSTSIGTLISVEGFCPVIQVNDQDVIPSYFKDDKSCHQIEQRSKQFVNDNSILSSLEPSVPAKRGRMINLQSQNLVCQVLDCNKDLSLSKDYHKRHKVCELHSKTAIVIVNGMQQRFCQQCSRFHRLTEFDEGKRSCRKRLADHNERRRKPQFDSNQSSLLIGSDLPNKSLIYPQILLDGLLGWQYNEPLYCRRKIKSVDKAGRLSQIEKPVKFNAPITAPPHLQVMEMQCPYKNLPFGSFSINKELSAESSSSSAFSLLSAQSQILLSSSSGQPISHPLIFQENHRANLNIDQNSTAIFRENNSDNCMPNGCETSNGIYPESSCAALCAGFSSGFEIPLGILSHDQNPINPNFHPSSDGANTLDLRQLSSHLQRVEHHKYSAQHNLENSIFCHSST